jgi:hypothetical protein
VAAERLKKPCGSGDQERTQPALPYSAVGTGEGLDTMRKHAKKIQRYLLNQMQVQNTQSPCLIAIKLKGCNMSWCCQAFLALSVMVYVILKSIKLRSVLRNLSKSIRR